MLEAGCLPVAQVIAASSAPGSRRRATSASLGHAGKLWDLQGAWGGLLPRRRLWGELTP